MRARTLFFMKKCYLDGNALCIVPKDFINLQESKSIFIKLTDEQIKEFNNLDKKISLRMEKLI